MSYRAAPDTVPTSTIAPPFRDKKPYEPTGIEAAVVKEIGMRDQRCKSASIQFRQQMQMNLQKRFCEWVDPNDRTELGEYFRNFVGRRVKKWAQFVCDIVFPDPVTYTHINVVADTPGTKIEEGMDIAAAVGSTRRARLAEIVATQSLRDNLRRARYRDAAFDALCNIGTFGVAIQTPDYFEERQHASPSYDATETETPFGFDETEAEGTTTASGTRVRASVYKVRQVDPRNFFPSSVEWDGGIEELDHWTEYDVASWRWLRERRAVLSRASGQWEGRYHNLESLSAEDEVFVHRVYYDDVDTSLLNTPLAASTSWSSSQLEKGFRICRYVGAFDAFDVKVDGKRPKAKEWKAFLRRFGNDPDKCEYARWWVAEIVYRGLSSTAGDGVLIRFEPCPVFDGMACPYVMQRFDKYPGLFHGQPLYKTCGHDEALANIFTRLFIRQALYGARPPAVFDPFAVDQAYMSQNKNTLRLVPGAVIPLASGRLSGAKPIEFLDMGYEKAMGQSADGITMMVNDIDEATNITGVQMGELTGHVTATNVAAAQQNAFTGLKSDAVTFESAFVSPMADMMLRATLESASEGVMTLKVRNYDDAVRLAPEDDTLGAIIEEYEREVVERLMPMELDIAIDIEGAQYRVEAMSNAAAGGKDALANAMQSFLKAAGEYNLKVPNQWDEKDIMIEWAKCLGIIRPERFQMSQESMDAALLLQMVQQKMGAMGGPQGSLAAPKGEASQPAEIGQSTDPTLAATGGVM